MHVNHRLLCVKSVQGQHRLVWKRAKREASPYATEASPYTSRYTVQETPYYHPIREEVESGTGVDGSLATAGEEAASSSC